ncbi:VWFA and cache domain-containing protein 1 [Macrobrachium rosenbergii]|uniref:VWFA and cache domain-containing protein 1 n=1 Tax=Macrobrachium rosenbergii TaxID=79674 RepID=UPI0034D49ABB
MMTRGPAHSVRRGRSRAALLTTLLPLAVSLLLWSSHSVAQESKNTSIYNNSLKNGDMGFSDDGSGSIRESKPVLYVNNPQLLREMQQQSFLRHNFRLSPGDTADGEDSGVLSGGIPLTERATTLASHLRQIANNELGVTHMQATFDELPYSDLERREEETVKEMIQGLERKFSLYSSLIEEMSSLVLVHYNQTFQTAKDPYAYPREELEYHACCLIPDTYLVYHSHFATRVNEEFSCDSGFGSGDHQLPSKVYAPTYNLTEMFIMNLRRYPGIKWQYFMGESGLHTEYPAHRPGTSIGSDCGQSSRHRHVYEATLRPKGRNIVLLFDLGGTLSPRLLITAKAIGHQIISTLTSKDHIAILGVANTISMPSAPCMRTSLVLATHDVRQTVRHFIDYIEIKDEPTNHTLGLTTALDVISNWSSELSSTDASVLLVYVSQGVLGAQEKIRTILRNVANKLQAITSQVVISAFGLGLIYGEPSVHKQFLEAIAYQEFDKYHIKTTKVPKIGRVVEFDSTLSVGPIINNFYDAVHEPQDYKSNSQALVISEPYWDEDSRGMIVSLTQSIQTSEGTLLGIIGIDVPLASLLEDVTHYSSPAQSYAFAIDSKGNVLSHPRLGRPERWSLPLIPTDVVLLEQTPGFHIIRDDLVNLSSGHRYTTQSLYDQIGESELHFWWRRSLSSGWVFVVVWRNSGMPHKRLSRNVPPLPPSALFHRLDLLSPSEARVCRHFNQMASLDGSTVFLAEGAYISPLSQVAVGPETQGVVQSITAYLSDGTQLIANPGLRLGVRTDASALYHITDFWKKQFQNSDLSKYIIRRYAAAPSGVTLMYPGTLLDRSYDPRAQAWYLDAASNPGKVVVSAPYLDPGGAGHIVTVSHTVYQGRSAAMHSPADPVVAVVATDFTLGFWYKLLLDLEPACGGDTDTEKKVGSIRCFLMDNKGFLVAHPSMLSPSSTSSLGTDIPPHITHQEPVVSMELLAGGGGLLTKVWCGRWWHGASERHYTLHLPPGQVVASSGNGNGQLDNSCLQYALTAVPATNLIFGIINQTCTPAVAFCPCSMDDRLCLNCQLFEAGACECPCECPLSSHPCSVPFTESYLEAAHSSIFSTLVSNHSEESLNQVWQTYMDIGSSKRFTVPQVLDVGMHPPNLAPTCDRIPEAAVPLQYSIGLLSHLDSCVSVSCSVHLTEKSCLGVMGCIWCSMTNDGESALVHPHCIEEQHCYGGILGGPSPYPHGLATLPHSDNTHGGSGSPIGPVAGGIMAVFLVVALAVYCYRQHVGGSSRSLYTPANFQSRPHQHPIYQPEPTHEIDNADEDLLGDVSGLGLGAAATISPYRMNPGYRRPPGQADSSDHGYSTMTPHDDSENLNYTDLGGIVSLPSLPVSSMLDDPPSSSGWSPPSSPLPQKTGNHLAEDEDPHDPSHTLLSSRKQNGPNIVIVPVIVHMVDTV